MGSRIHALEKSQTAQAISSQSELSLWIDGVLDSERLEKLKQFRDFVSGVQYERYYVGKLRCARYATGMNLREFLDPHVFVLQMNTGATVLEINFNPTPDQVEALRRIYSQIKLTVNR